MKSVFACFPNEQGWINYTLGESLCQKKLRQSVIPRSGIGKKYSDSFKSLATGGEDLQNQDLLLTIYFATRRALFFNTVTILHTSSPINPLESNNLSQSGVALIPIRHRSNSWISSCMA
ncbi:hypothetical protein Tco_1067206 [Tanacetum coccineum]|uniref:Uncharacterized protein n=1 Tax=Tanacetum coccineum TaxID=301880 RepID=A0ABQ5HD26_9ASTR